MRLAFITMKELDTSGMRFFEVVADVIVNSTAHGFSFPQIICLGLFNLSHPGARARNLALQILEAAHEKSSGMLSIARFEAAVGSSAPSIYQHAHRLVSDVLAGEQRHLAHRKYIKRVEPQHLPLQEGQPFYEEIQAYQKRCVGYARNFRADR